MRARQPRPIPLLRRPRRYWPCYLWRWSRRQIKVEHFPTGELGRRLIGRWRWLPWRWPSHLDVVAVGTFHGLDSTCQRRPGRGVGYLGGRRGRSPHSARAGIPLLPLAPLRIKRLIPFRGQRPRRITVPCPFGMRGGCRGIRNRRRHTGRVKRRPVPSSGIGELIRPLVILLTSAYRHDLSPPKSFLFCQIWIITSIYWTGWSSLSSVEGIRPTLPARDRRRPHVPGCSWSHPPEIIHPLKGVESSSVPSTGIGSKRTSRCLASWRFYPAPVRHDSTRRLSSPETCPCSGEEFRDPLLSTGREVPHRVS